MKTRSARRAKYAKNNPVNQARPDMLPPTPEHIAQPDGPTKGAHGGYRVIGALERLFNRQLLDEKNKEMNGLMFIAAGKLQDLFTRSGLLSSIHTIELDRIIGCGVDPAHMMPQTEAAYNARQEWLAAVDEMGYYRVSPFRGNARVVLAVVCQGHTVREAARMHLNCNGGKADDLAMDRLRNGLMELVARWRLGRARNASRPHTVSYRDFSASDVSW